MAAVSVGDGLIQGPNRVGGEVAEAGGTRSSTAKKIVSAQIGGESAKKDLKPSAKEIWQGKRRVNQACLVASQGSHRFGQPL